MISSSGTTKRKREIIYKEHENIFLAVEAEEPEFAKVQSIIHLKNVEKKFDLFLNKFRHD